MKKRVYGVTGVRSIASNWNADFDNYPKAFSDGQIFGSSQAFKYTMKKLWDENDELVFCLKSRKWKIEKKGNKILVPRSLKERYEYLFPDKELKDSDSEEILKNLFQSIDFKNFGTAFTEGSGDISFKGAVQFGTGFNHYEECEVHEQGIQSEFRNPNGKTEKDTSDDGEKNIKENEQTSLGSRIVTSEAHYFYPFSINPNAYKEHIDLGVTEGYTEEDYMKFKEAALTCATAYDSDAKKGCENEFAMFVECDSSLILKNLTEYIRFEKGDPEDKNSKNKIIISTERKLKKKMKKIKSIEIYYDTYDTEIVTDLENVKYYDVDTLEEV